jgi:cell division protein ZapA (FtsZ GTPase activity inhibitor)
MQDVSIELHIANRKYPLKVRAEEADSVKKAAELINEKLKSLEQRYGVKDMQDLFAMSALQITTQLVKLEAGHESNSEDLEKQIENMSQQIDAVLSQ